MTELNSSSKPIMLWILGSQAIWCYRWSLLTLLAISVLIIWNLFVSLFVFGCLTIFHNLRDFTSSQLSSTQPTFRVSSTRLLVSDHSLLLCGQVFQRCNQPRGDKRSRNATPLRGFCGLGTESGTEKFYKSRDSNISRDMPRYAKHSSTQDDSEI